METLGNLLKIKKRRSGLKRPLEIYELFGEWNRRAQEIFGNKTVRCQPKVLRGKTLIVEVEGASAATELRLRQYQLVKRINQHFGRTMVERIVFKLNS